MTRVLICGAGSGAHALAGMMSLRSDVEVRVFIDNRDKVRRWQEQMSLQPLKVKICDRENSAPDEFLANPFMVTHDPEQASRNCDIIILVLPAFLHLEYLQLLTPYIEEGCIIIGLPGQTGFEFDVRYALGTKINNSILMNFESLPWISRTVEFGQEVDIVSFKARLVGALQGNLAQARIRDPLACLQNLLGNPPELVISGHLLGITLISQNAYCHPPIMYGRWQDWDGQPLDHQPLFYEAVNEYTANLLEKLSDEVLAISHQITAKYPEIDLSEVIPMYDWEIAHYGKYIKDQTNLMTINQTNFAYQGITHPMRQLPDNSYLPDFNHRFLTEDVPFGLVVIRGIGEIVGVPTPNIDLVLSWCQEKLQKEYLVDSKLIGKDLGTTRCPQRYGFHTIEEVLGLRQLSPIG